jgi:hypothetical protein
MFRSLPDHHQRVHAFLVKVTELKCEYSCVVMWQNNVQCIYVMFGVVRCAESAHLTTPNITLVSKVKISSILGHHVG